VCAHLAPVNDAPQTPAAFDPALLAGLNPQQQPLAIVLRLRNQW